MHDAASGLEQAAELFASDPAELAGTLVELSDAYYRRGDFEAQEEVLWRALEHAIPIGDHHAVAGSWNGLGISYAARGRGSAALAAYHRCLEIYRQLDDAPGAATIRHNLGVQLLLLGRIDEGIAELEGAASERRRLGDLRSTGISLASLAWGYTLDDQDNRALATYAETIDLQERSEARHELAITYEQRTPLLRRLGRLAEARHGIERSLALYGGEAPPFNAAYLDLELGAVLRAEDEDSKRDDSERDRSGLPEAARLLRRSLATFDEIQAHDGRIMSRFELARVLRALEDLRGAEEHLEDALAIIESARSELRLPSFRATFLSGWQPIYHELVDLLAEASWQLRRKGQEAEAQDLAERALGVAERARARALLDRMASKDPAEESDAARALRNTVEALESRAVNAGGDRGRGAGLSASEAREELRQARSALDRTREVSSDRPPSPAAKLASVDAIQECLDANTTLLVYALAPERGWLWRIDATSVEVMPLADGTVIDAEARRVHELLPRQDQHGYSKAAPAALRRLAEKVLVPVAQDLPPRLAIVPDAALHLVPFGALPLADDTPLAEHHEVVQLPSASTLVELRRRAGRRQPASGLLAVVADPVFEADDPRLATAGQTTASKALAMTRAALRDRLERLPASADEAAHIADIARQSTTASETQVHQGFDAHRELVTSGALDNFRILHFATHGIADAEDPALAGLVLSLYDANGQPRDGLLRARDLHHLRLAADLVVLSACRTALGQEIRGEGLVGLADGFFAAGASHLVVSLWDVDDRATAELMKRFYRHLLEEGRRPGDALRLAQRELRQETEWRSPVHWAAFVAWGDGDVRLGVDGGDVRPPDGGVNDRENDASRRPSPLF